MDRATLALVLALLAVAAVAAALLALLLFHATPANEGRKVVVVVTVPVLDTSAGGLTIVHRTVDGETRVLRVEGDPPFLEFGALVTDFVLGLRYRGGQIYNYTMDFGVATGYCGSYSIPKPYVFMSSETLNFTVNASTAVPTFVFLDAPDQVAIVENETHYILRVTATYSATSGWTVRTVGIAARVGVPGYGYWGWYLVAGVPVNITLQPGDTVAVNYELVFPKTVATREFARVLSWIITGQGQGIDPYTDDYDGLRCYDKVGDDIIIEFWAPDGTVLTRERLDSVSYVVNSTGLYVYHVDGFAPAVPHTVVGGFTIYLVTDGNPNLVSIRVEIPLINYTLPQPVALDPGDYLEVRVAYVFPNTWP